MCKSHVKLICCSVLYASKTIHYELWARRLAAVSCCARRFYRHFSWKSLWIIRITEVWEIPVALLIWREVWCFCGASSWLSTNSSTALTLLSARTVRGRPLPGRRSIVPVFFSLSKKLFTDDTFHPLLENSLISFLAPKPFNELSSEIKIRSSLVSTGMFTKSKRRLLPSQQ